MRNRCQIFRILFCAILLLINANVFAQNDGPLKDLARKIVQHIQTRSAVAITTRNLSNVPAADFSNAQHELESQLRSLDVRLVKPEQATENLRVTLAESQGGLIWVAEIERPGSREVSIIPAGRFESVTPRVSGGVAIRRTFLWKQNSQILDVASISISRVLLVLQPERIVLHTPPDAQVQEFSIPHTHPWPRDMRGRLVLIDNGNFEAQLPGVKCSGSTLTLSATNCTESDDPWRLGSVRAFYNSSRNYFTGMVVPPLQRDTRLPPFFSMAEVPQNGLSTVSHSANKVFLFDGVDGRTRVMNAAGENLSTVGGWGSDIAGVTAECGSGSFILATRVSESDRPDSIHAFELVNREPVEASAPIEVPGSVVALWTSAELTTATTIVQNPKTTEYEAYSLSVNCSR